ncbi:hypothetical protein TNIN_249721 [Trichonephila inaurata madagascariensis]|uniref:Uncharacterized protein n=1 Tax=Trichonephila inaurata madagascariensis TaxID=2747483 RepID=A0A8X7BNY8_9ARAC|nr:hypothetical protein TNIN_249721 [Trichonephila inaurata madagascariensis]
MKKKSSFNLTHGCVGDGKTVRFAVWLDRQSPPIPPDLEPSDFHLFGNWKKFVSVKHIACNGGVERVSVLDEYLHKHSWKELRCWRNTGPRVLNSKEIM